MSEGANIGYFTQPEKVYRKSLNTEVTEYTCGNNYDHICSSVYPQTAETGFDRQDDLLYNKEQDALYTSQDPNKEAGSMSFAGIIFHPQLKRIIGFADRKSSLPLYNRTIEHPEKKEVTKIFKKDNFIITFVSTNAFLLPGKGNYKTLYLDDWVQNNIDRCQSPYGLILLLRDFLYKNSASKDYSVIIQASYLTEDHIPLSINSTIKANSFSLTTNLIEGFSIMTSGDESYLNEFKKREELLYTTDVKELETNLQMVCNEFDRILDYNPVGIGWDIKQIEY